ncbi:MAG TPA: methylmalonyl Co-A mutase-associated GTPase MeaB, partial [Myxococcota bacterium]|nr:methylmalonyl Co-A mutase-associated GTPase MeaB [Myxococcota bacterium]
ALGWKPVALAASALTGEGVGELWRTALEQRELLAKSGALEQRRRSQAREWMWSLVEEGLQRALRENREVAQAIPRLEADVEAQRLTPAAAARALLAGFLRRSEGGAP